MSKQEEPQLLAELQQSLELACIQAAADVDRKWAAVFGAEDNYYREMRAVLDSDMAEGDLNEILIGYRDYHAVPLIEYQSLTTVAKAASNKIVASAHTYLNAVKYIAVKSDQDRVNTILNKYSDKMSKSGNGAKLHRNLNRLKVLSDVANIASDGQCKFADRIELVSKKLDQFKTILNNGCKFFAAFKNWLAQCLHFTKLHKEVAVEEHKEVAVEEHKGAMAAIDVPWGNHDAAVDKKPTAKATASPRPSMVKPQILFGAHMRRSMLHDVQKSLDQSVRMSAAAA
ncbi:MAG: hypothetical protein COB66_02850 [Coxiella sp. (in: Bacteria)]|nr:MAG: hypothetical protein COB66_02850 [Coxiella sp. (in: g-proteobacteria)]